MKPRHRRLVLIALAVSAFAGAAALILNAFQSNMVFFFSPTQVAEKAVPQAQDFRLGGLVEEGSLIKNSHDLGVRFVVTDLVHKVPVTYTGLLPDLFKEGKGVVAQGKLGPDGVFRAEEVLAKHDENYMPPEAAKALQDAARRQQPATKP
ncbi:MAG: cytochrome c maturation protein CcmE [Polaromonas sp.]|jgi:cytochrome c-type biogenesis protein CcmE|nr:cytochrome c maturation protein CcmE [Polaromonas sp.]